MLFTCNINIYVITKKNPLDRSRFSLKRFKRNTEEQATFWAGIKQKRQQGVQGARKKGSNATIAISVDIFTIFPKLWKRTSVELSKGGTNTTFTFEKKHSSFLSGPKIFAVALSTRISEFAMYLPNDKMSLRSPCRRVSSSRMLEGRKYQSWRNRITKMLLCRSTEYAVLIQEATAPQITKWLYRSRHHSLK